MNYKGFEYEYDKLFGWVLYDENYCPISRAFENEEEIKEYIDLFEEVE